MDRPARWRLPDIDPARAHSLAQALGSLPPVARVLLRRGYDDPCAARRFLNPSIEDLYDPFLLRGVDRAVERLQHAIARGEKILLYGDYDVDGTTSIVILKKAIELAGGQACFHVPHRIRDGYGMRLDAVEQAAADSMALIISLDTGIRAAAAVRRANELGIDVIVTDHHLPDADLPPAVAVLNPNQPGCAYPEKSLCGVGVAFKLVQALLGTLDWPAGKLRRMLESFLKLVAIGTVADVVPLTGENRVFVKFGLAGLKSVRNPGLKALLAVAGFAGGEVPSSGDVAFRIAPRLNAAGRMADANDIVNLLLTDDEERARSLADRLHSLNRDRQEAESDIVRLALEECLRFPVTDSQAALVFSGADWHLGVVGIVAARLVERFHRPVFVLSENSEQGIVQGSGRSIPQFHLLEALESMPDLFIRFGGHRQAAGVALQAERVGEFRERLNAWSSARLTPDDFMPQIDIDAPLAFTEIGERGIAEVLSMAPFGCGNPSPVFAAFGVEVAGSAIVWKEKHLRVNFRQNGRTVTFKAWNFAPRLEEFAPGRRLDVAFCFESDDYWLSQGQPGWCAVLKDVREPVSGAPAKVRA
jgi:single-stranded-DNA-specific exonuclease